MDFNNERGHLVLSRRVGESIVIGGNIIVTVTEINGDQIKIKCTAPKSTSVNRMEIQQKIDAHKKRGQK